MIDLTRRRLLEVGTAGIGLSIAGCLGEPASETTTEWFPASDDRFLAAYLDLELTRDTSGVDPVIPLFLPSNDDDPTEYVPELPSTDELEDPLVRFPLAAGGQVIAVGALMLAATGLGHLVDPDDPTRGITDLFVVNETTIATGDIDTAEAEESLRSGTDGVFGEIKFTPAGDRGRYTLYRSDTADGGTVALSEDAVITAETSAAVHTVIDTRNGDTDRIVEANETAEWLFDTAGMGDLSVGWLGSIDLEEYYWDAQSMSQAAELLGQRENVLSTLSFSPESDEITADLAIDGLRLDETVAERIESRLGSTAAETTMSVESDRLVATGTYTNDVLDIEFVQREPRETTRVPSGDDVPETVATAVEEGSFTFERQEANSLVRVNFRGEIAADEVVIRARPSGNEASTTTPEPINYLNVQVASDDEEVVVIVTVDDSSGIVARTTLE